MDEFQSLKQVACEYEYPVVRFSNIGVRADASFGARIPCTFGKSP
jgi:hypothetical protein